MHLDFAFVSHFRALHTMTWAVLLSLLIVAFAATLGRATVNLRGALAAEDGSLAVMLLLPDEGISDVTLVKAGVDTQEFLVETKDGPKLIRLKKGEKEWFVQEKITLRE
ncbi:MAG: hypothetical protein HOO67_05730 [Candidatus Peribacteraceae bacterium]|nr:hypothetical protein [Candidatus Peribacteraceae bacterium]